MTTLVALLVVSVAGCDDTPPDECPEPPRALNTMPNLVMLVGEVVETSLLEPVSLFGHPCFLELSYEASSSVGSAVDVSISGITLTTTALDEADSVRVRLSATDPNGRSAAHRFLVSTEHPNQAPIVVGSIAPVEVPSRGYVNVNIEGVFVDPDGDPLAYCDSGKRGQCEVADTSIATVPITSEGGLSLQVNGKRVGRTTATVEATDPEGLSASLEVSITVTEPSG